MNTFFIQIYHSETGEIEAECGIGRGDLRTRGKAPVASQKIYTTEGDPLQKQVLTKKTDQMNSDQALVKRLRQKDEKAIYVLYRMHFPTVEKYIVLNSGTKEDAEDIFQEAILILLLKVSCDDFSLSASVKTFLFSICRNLWLKHLRNLYRKIDQGEWARMQHHLLSDSAEVERSEWQWETLPVVLGRITRHCSGLLKELFLTGKIPQHYKNEHTRHNQKYKCLDQARKIVRKLSVAAG